MTEPKIIPQQFVAQNNTLANYNYSDIAEGTGVKYFYGSVVTNSSGNNYILTTDSSFYSSVIEPNGSTSGTDFTKAMDVDFDLTSFNLPKSVKGTATVVMGIAIGTATANQGDGYVIVKIRKYSGTTETEIGSSQSQTLTATGATFKEAIISMQITLTETHFKKGDLLRLTIEMWGKKSGAANYCYTYFGADPLNRDGTVLTPSSDNSTTQLKIAIPFRLDELGY